jgi:hypothetical protein
MTYTENILAEATKIIAEKKLNATIGMIGLSAYLIIDGNRINFTTPKLAKIYLEKYIPTSTVKIETTSSAATSHMEIVPPSGVSQKNDETPKKRRGRPKKADNDRRKLL